MAGIPAAVTFNAGEGAKDQAAAVMMAEHNALQHVGDWTGWNCFSSDGTNASANSNLALGSAGPDAITGYIWDFGANNFEVGHRRWILYPQTQVMATGDVPSQNSYNSANATWVFDANYGGPRPATRTPYVPWPPAGYVPYQVVFPQWSFALSNANFSNATVSMTSNGIPVAITKQLYLEGYGENSLVWYPNSLNPSTTVTFPFNGMDTVYAVTINNVATTAGIKNFTYNVTLFDPAVPGADYFPATISGTNLPSVGVANPYTFTTVTNATSYQWRATLRTPFNFNDGAENGLTNFVVNTSAGYSVTDSTVHASGTHSFHLVQPTPPVDQTLTLNQTFTPKTNTVVSFKSRLGLAASAQTAEMQISVNQGASWINLFSQTGNMSGNPVETSFVTRSFALTNFVGIPIQLRFNYSITTGSYYNQTSSGFGWNLDDIVVTNSEALTFINTNSISSTNFNFIPAQTGNYNLEARGLIFSEFPLNWGTVKQVTAVVGPPVITLNAPVISGNQVKINFTLTSGSASTFHLLQANLPGGSWITNASAVLATNIPGSSYQFTTTNGSTTRFYRVQTP